VELFENIVNLYPISHINLIKKIFEFAGIQAEMSQAGKIAFQVIRQMREYAPLEACRVFKIRGVRKLLKVLKEKKNINWDEALKEIGSNEFERFKQLYIAPCIEPELRPQDVLKYLLKKGILVPFLGEKSFKNKKKKFKCPQCGLISDVQYNYFSKTKNWRCKYCGSEHYLPKFIIDIFTTEELNKIWKFKMSDLFSKHPDQQGAIPVILTLLQLKRSLNYSASSFVYSTSLELKTSFCKKCETDLVVLHYGNNYNESYIEIGIGECKREGTIENKDIENLKCIKDLLNKKGLKCFLIFSKTTNSFTKDEIELFKKLKGEVILFTNKELEPYHPYDEWQQTPSLPFRVPFKLENMAWNSAYLYLS